MKKTIAGIYFMIVCSIISYSQTVSEEEILSIKDQISSIVFENYVGPVTEFSTREEITGIGRYLGEKKDSSPSWGDKYRLYHSFQPEIPDGLDGDILAILENAGVDHIRNLRMIIAGYLQSVYQYSTEDASTLSEFITYYNAIYYRKMEHFSSKYKTGVLEYLSPENAGLSTHYSEWPGKSRIVIPISSGVKTGAITAELDTSIISQPEVVEEMRKEEDMALETRKDMVQIREEEIDQKQEEIDKAQEQLVEEKIQVEEAKQEKEQQLSQVEEGSPEEAVLKEEIQVLEEKEQTLEEKQDKITQEQEQLDKEQEEVLVMREEIAKDENTSKEEPKIQEIRNEEVSSESIVASTDGTGLWFILIDRPGDPASFGTLCKITAEGIILKKSPINSIRGNTAVDTGKGIVLIAGKEDANTSVNPVLIDRSTLELIKQSNSIVYAGSSIWTDKTYLFIITRNDSDWVLGKYSYDLDLLNTSGVSVNPDSSLLFDNANLLIQNADGTISVLLKEDLTEIKQ